MHLLDPFHLRLPLISGRFLGVFQMIYSVRADNSWAGLTGYKPLENSLLSKDGFACSFRSDFDFFSRDTIQTLFCPALPVQSDCQSSDRFVKSFTSWRSSIWRNQDLDSCSLFHFLTIFIPPALFSLRSSKRLYSCFCCFCSIPY